MKRLAFALAAIGLVGATLVSGTATSATSDEPDEPSSTDSEGRFETRIVGGANADITDVPWQVAITDTAGNQFCGGSILSERWIITAAHCVDTASAASLRVWAGSSTLPAGPGDAGLRTVDTIGIHPGYVDPFTNDIALLRLTAPMPLDGTAMTPIDLAVNVPPAWPAAGTPAVASGWGALSSGGTFPDHLQSVTVEVLTDPSDPNCGIYGGDYLPAVMLCAGVDGGGKDACQGDSGGPLAVQHEGRWVLAGITSWGDGCAEALYPGVYTRVGSYVDEIAPGAPTSPTATLADPGQVTVSWIAPGTTGLQPIEGYTVEGSRGGSCTTAGATSCTVSGLEGGAAHTFVVRATNGIAPGPRSVATTQVTLPAIPGAPGATAAIAGDAAVTLAWTAPTSTGGTPITGYVVSGSPSGSCSTTGATTCEITGLTNGAPYTFTVRATNAVGTGPASVPSPSVTPLGKFRPLSPSRLLDTRSTGRVGAADGNGTPLTINVNGRNGLPTTGIGAIALNVTVVDTENPTIGGGYLTAYPCTTRPDASNLNFTTNQIVANTVIAPVSPTGDICFYVYGTANLIADISGYLPR